MKEIRFRRLKGQMKLLKLSDASLQCFNKGVRWMMFACYGDKVLWSVVRPNTVKVMTNFSGLQWSPHFLSQHKAMFQNACSIQVSDNYVTISPRSISTALPVGMIFTFARVRPAFITSLCVFIFFTATSWASIIIARASGVVKHIAFGTGQATLGAKLKVACTSLKGLVTILAYQISHILSVTQCKEIVK